MLFFMRKHAKFFYVFFFLVIISFVFFYVGPIDKNQNPVVAVVGKENIHLNEYWTAYDNLTEFYKDIYKDQFNDKLQKKLNIKEKALERLIEDRLLFIRARELGLTVTDRELQEAIMHEPAFQRNGRFSRDIYIRTLQLNRLNPAYYEDMKRRELLVRKLRLLVEEPVTVSEEELGELKGQNPDLVKALRDAMLRDKRARVFQSYIDSLKKEYGVVVHRELIG
ncbi:MAG TPA: hypothetical protein ENK09_01455 [Nitrospirae bacterium]|nr:hypothetical protein [Nitrospirota bacterium]